MEAVDAVIVQLPENVLFISGLWPMIGITFLVFPAEGKPVCIIPDCYENEFPHITGHGVSFAYHEPSPTIAPGNPEVLDIGMIYTIEPGIYPLGIVRIRLKDNILVAD